MKNTLLNSLFVISCVLASLSPVVASAGEAGGDPSTTSNPTARAGQTDDSGEFYTTLADLFSQDNTHFLARGGSVVAAFPDESGLIHIERSSLPSAGHEQLRLYVRGVPLLTVKGWQEILGRASVFSTNPCLFMSSSISREGSEASTNHTVTFQIASRLGEPFVSPPDTDISGPRVCAGTESGIDYPGLDFYVENTPPVAGEVCRLFVAKPGQSFAKPWELLRFMSVERFLSHSHKDMEVFIDGASRDAVFISVKPSSPEEEADEEEEEVSPPVHTEAEPAEGEGEGSPLPAIRGDDGVLRINPEAYEIDLTQRIYAPEDSPVDFYIDGHGKDWSGKRIPIRLLVGKSGDSSFGLEAGGLGLPVREELRATGTSQGVMRIDGDDRSVLILEADPDMQHVYAKRDT